MVATLFKFLDYCHVPGNLKFKAKESGSFLSGPDYSGTDVLINHVPRVFLRYALITKLNEHHETVSVSVSVSYIFKFHCIQFIYN